MDYAGAKYYKMSQTAASILKYRCKNYGFRADCRNRCQGMLFANIQTVVLTGFRAHSDHCSYAAVSNAQLRAHLNVDEYDPPVMINYPEKSVSSNNKKNDGNEVCDSVGLGDEKVKESIEPVKKCDETSSVGQVLSVREPEPSFNRVIDPTTVPWVCHGSGNDLVIKISRAINNQAKFCKSFARMDEKIREMNCLFEEDFGQAKGSQVENEASLMDQFRVNRIEASEAKLCEYFAKVDKSLQELDRCLEIRSVSIEPIADQPIVDRQKSPPMCPEEEQSVHCQSSGLDLMFEDEYKQLASKLN